MKQMSLKEVLRRFAPYFRDYISYFIIAIAGRNKAPTDILLILDLVIESEKQLMVLAIYLYSPHRCI